MSFYSNDQLKIPALLKKTFAYYGIAFKASWFFIALAVVTYHVAGSLQRFIAHPLAQIIFLVVMVLLSLYFWSAALYSVHQSLQNTPASLKETFIKLWPCFYKIVLVVVLYVGIFALMIFWLRILNHFMVNLPLMMRWWVTLFLVGFPLLLFMLLFLLSIPLIIMHNESFLRALGHSAKMVWLSIFKTTLVLYAGIILLAYLVLPYTHHTQWFIEHHLKVVYDLVLLLVFAPLLLNYALLLTHNLTFFILLSSTSSRAKRGIS